MRIIAGFSLALVLSCAGVWAQATVHGMAILTPDEAIAQYAARVLW